MKTIVRTLGVLYRGGLRDERVLQFFRFGSVGVVNTSVDLGFYFALTRLLPFGEFVVLAKGVSYFIATVVSFFLNRFWTFKKSSSVRWHEVGRFYASVAFAILVNTAAMYFFTSMVGLHDGIAALLATGTTMLWNFFSMKFWVYSEEKKEETTYVPGRSIERRRFPRAAGRVNA